MPKIKSARNICRDRGLQSEPSAISRKKKMTVDVCKQIIDDLQIKFEQQANATQAAASKKYMRGQFEYFGVRAPRIIAMSKQVSADHPNLGQGLVRDVVHAMWRREEREWQYLACEILIRHKAVLCEKETESCLQALDFAKHLLTTKSWWDTVDKLSPHIVGYVVSKNPEQTKPVMEQWINHDCMWLRRSAILYQLSYKDQTDEEQLFKFCLLRAHEEEFFIQKAMGWALRTYLRHNPSSVKAFVKNNKTTLPKLTVREALKHA